MRESEGERERERRDIEAIPGHLSLPISILCKE